MALKAKLNRLIALFEAGALSEQEFVAAKKAIAAE